MYMKRGQKQNIRVVGFVLAFAAFLSVAYHVVEGKIEDKYQQELNSQTWGSKNYGVKVEPLTFDE